MEITLVLIVILLGLLYTFLTWNFNYWTKRGITGPRPLPIFGNFRKSFIKRRHLTYDLDEIYRAYKDQEDFVGVFHSRTPQLLILNPQLCQRIFMQDFKHFQDNEFSAMVDKSSDVIAANNPFALTGAEWKSARSFLKHGLDIETTETIYKAITEACRKMRFRIEELNNTTPKEGIKVKELTLHYSTEVITDYVFGFNFCGQATAQLVFDAIFNCFHNRKDMLVYFLLTYLLPNLRNVYKARILPQRVVNLFVKLMQTAIDLRKSQSVNIDRRDFLNYMLEFQKQKNMSTLEMTTHSMNFILHGFLGTYTILAHCLLLLAKHPKTQERLRNALQQHTEKNRAINFEIVTQLPYLEACILETIRLLSPGNFASKICTEPILLPNKSGRSVRLEKGEIVLLPSHSIMNDETYYKNAKEFQPERFIGSNGSIIDDFHRSGLFYGFGAGPRECVGKRFASAQLKAALVEILCNFKLRVNPKTKQSIEADPKFISIHLTNEIWLDFDAIR